MTTIKRFTPDYKMHAVRFEAFAREAEHGEFVKFSDYEALVSELASIRQINAQTLQVKLTMAESIKKLTDRVNGLAVENAGFKHALSVILEHVDVTDKGPAGVVAMIANDELFNSETPATDAALAAIQAQGVERLIKLKMEQLASMHPDTHAFGAIAESLRAQINELQAFAANIREAK
ncbi:hypothetical protein ACSBQS_19645 [Serratia sp. H402Y]|uniref:hypothetical protein n=1 Tax=Serratia sp. H402Y TaxID=3444320 RepID=UPI003EBA0909